MFPARVRRLLVLLLVLSLSVIALVWQRHYRAAGKRGAVQSLSAITPALMAEFTAIEQRELRLDETIWAPERRAEQCGAVFEALWDKLNQATNKLDVLADFPIGELLVADYAKAEPLICQIEISKPTEPHRNWTQGDWRAFLEKCRQEGWRLGHIEFRQRAFDPAIGMQPERSQFAFRADVENTNGFERATLEGDLLVTWGQSDPGAEPVISQIDARGVSIRSRSGQPPFTPVLTETIVPFENWLFIDPVILYDLDGDGLPEIVLAGKNLVYHRQADGSYRAAELCKYGPGRIYTAVIADFDGDGHADFLCAKPEGLFLFHGSPSGTFDEPGRLVWAANPHLKYGQVLTCGDIDGDGDLDVFLAQYKSPYFHGQMPTPYYDANDGEPAYLLLNDGKGNFTDATEKSGLGTKRWRRSYSASFMRLPGDTNLDLVVVSDFAGAELYRNDGHGHFTDVTKQCLPDPLGFGMAHAFADFNGDGLLDLLMIGMDSPAVDRLEHLGLRRDDGSDRKFRARLASGNRLWLAQPDGSFQQSADQSITHSGWSWGCSAFDFDNDGWPDVYIANGHETRSTVRDYEPEFWLHDIYVAGSTNNRAAELYFESKFTQTRARGYSYRGYEQNRLYLNRQGESFLEAGHLMGVGLEQDCRNAVAGDLDGDGKMDLLVSTFEVWPAPKQTLHVYRNTFPQAGNWIGFRFREEGHGKSPVGATVTIHYAQRTAVAELMTGDSYRSQSGNTLHFGLGTSTQVDWAEVVWPNGSRSRLESPSINRYIPLSQTHQNRD